MTVSEDSQGEWKTERRERARHKEPFKTEIFRRQTGKESEGGREVAQVEEWEDPGSWRPGARRGVFQKKCPVLPASLWWFWWNDGGLSLGGVEEDCEVARRRWRV